MLCSCVNDSEEHKTGSGAGFVKKCHPVVPAPLTRLRNTFFVLPTAFELTPSLPAFIQEHSLHSLTYTTTVFSVPFKNPLYCKSCSVQSCWRPVSLPLLRQSITKMRIQYFLEDCDHLFCSRPRRERLLCDHKQYKQKQPAVTLLNASNFLLLL